MPANDAPTCASPRAAIARAAASSSTTPAIATSAETQEGVMNETALYPRRFWVLFMLSIASMQQGYLWLTWSPMAYPVQALYGWSDFTITLLVAWGPIGYVALILFTPKIVDRIGLRACITLACLLCAIGACIRCITTDGPAALWLAHIGQIFVGLSGPFVYATPSGLSAAWFQPSVRTKATAITTMASYVGSAIGFLVALPITRGDQVSRLLYWEAGLSVFFLALACSDHYWRALPLLPPSISSGIHQSKSVVLIDTSGHNGATNIVVSSSKKTADALSTWALFKEMISLLKNGQFMLLAMIYGITQGTLLGWSGVLNPLLTPLGFTQDQATWIGFSSTIAGIIGGVVLGGVADRIKRVKALLIVLYFLGTLSLGWFTLATSPREYISTSVAQVYIACSLGNLFITATVALFYEATVEIIFPVGEIAANSALTIPYNIAGAVYCLITSYLDGATMNWLLTGCCAAGTIALFFFNETQARRRVDDGTTKVATANGDKQGPSLSSPTAASSISPTSLNGAHAAGTCSTYDALGSEPSLAAAINVTSTGHGHHVVTFHVNDDDAASL